MKKYSDEDYSRTDVNGAWNPLKPISEGFEFVGDDQYDNFLTKKGKERREERKKGRSEGLTRKEARKQAKNKFPTDKPARRETYLALVKINFRGFAYKLDAIINGTNTDLLNKLKEKWRKWGDWNELIDAVNKGKTKKPHVCGAKCRKESLDAKKYYSVDPATATIIGSALALAGVVINNMGDVVNQAQIGNQQKRAIESAEKQGQDEFNNLPPEEQEEIIKAEEDLRKEAEQTDNKKYIWIGVGVIALLGIIYLTTKKK
jgi:hypothetical protein